MTDKELKKRILELKREKDALILVHNYQVIEIQDIGDFIGDSLELARKATEVKKPIIVFCGVNFMAETAKILNPEARVLIPRNDAGCPMADMITQDDVIELKAQYPDAVVCSYVNTNADVKAETDLFLFQPPSFWEPRKRKKKLDLDVHAEDIALLLQQHGDLARTDFETDYRQVHL